MNFIYTFIKEYTIKKKFLDKEMDTLFTFNLIYNNILG